MTEINYRRVMLGGMAAGSAALAVEYAAFFAGGYAKLGDSAGLPAIGHPTIVAQVALAALQLFIGGPMAMWLYAVLRSYYGAGIGTTLRAALYLWLVLGPYGLVVLAIGNLLVKFPPAVLVLLEATSLPFIVLMISVGAWQYRPATRFS